MKILAVADLHYALKQFDWLTQVAPDFDLLVIAGDLLDISSPVDGRTQIAVLLKYLQRLQGMTQLVICSGNHDLDQRNADGEKAATWFERIRRMGIPVDGEALEFDGYLFTACAWWDGPKTKERVSQQLARDAGRVAGRKWAWVYHGPPEGSTTSCDDLRCFGDTDLARWIGEHTPDLVFCGHVHNSPFSRDGSWVDRLGRTWVFNGGHDIGPVPPHIVLSTDREEAAWVSNERIESVDLAAPLVRPLARLKEPPAWLSAGS